MVRDKIEWDRVFDNLPTVTGLPFTRHGNKWYAHCYIDGTKHDRWDKTMARMVDDGIQILEQGGDKTTLWSWMIRYGGCDNVQQAKERLLNLSTSNLIIPSEPVKRAMRHASWSAYQEKAEQLSQIKDPLFLFLEPLYGYKKTMQAYQKYNITPTVCRDGSIGTQFWYVNSRREICSDKIMFFGPDGHRNRAITPKNRFKAENGYTDRCLFGEHRTIGKTECIKVVESEKTALICYLEYGGCWVATGGLTNLNLLERLKGKRVYLVPDMDAVDKWSAHGRIWEWWKKCEGVGDKWDIADWIIANK